MNENFTPPANLGPTKVQKTWFFERGDGFIFACDEREAWNLLNNRTNWMRRDFKMLGVSSGETYVEVLKSSQQEAQTLIKAIADLKHQEKRVLEAEDKMRFDDFVADDDPKLLRAVALRQKTQKELAEKEAQLANINQDITQKAFAAELAKARGNFEQPRNFDVITPNEADRNKILSRI
jgi:hypothetical protein